MVETVSVFPFSKLRYDTYLTLDVMMHLDYQEAYKFMFTVNKEGRSFLSNNFITISNGFINDGLIPFKLKCGFGDFLEFEKLYFSALKRNIGNRIISILIEIDRYNFKYCNEVVDWI
jgi:hypothetical protein